MITSMLAHRVPILLVALTLHVSSDTDPRCASPGKPDLIACAENQLRVAQASLERYVAEAAALREANPEARKSFRTAQAAWEKFVDAQCRSVYDESGQGEREIQSAFCRAEMTQTRVRDIWAIYLRTSGSKLPEPARPAREQR